MKKLIVIIIFYSFFSCKHKAKQETISFGAKKNNEITEILETEIEYSNDMPTEYLNHDENINIEIDTMKIGYNELNLFFVRKSFEPKKHELDKSKLTIDGGNFFGTDGDFPEYELSESYVKMNGQKISLETSKMYNPWFGKGAGFRHKIIFNNVENGILIYGIFSDGAGSYGAEWLVNNNNEAKRLELTNDEHFIFKYD